MVLRNSLLRQRVFSNDVSKGIFRNKLPRLTTLSPKFRTRHGRYTVCPTNALTFAAVGSKTGKSPSVVSLLASFGRRSLFPFGISRSCAGAASKTTCSRNYASTMLYPVFGIASSGSCIDRRSFLQNEEISDPLTLTRSSISLFRFSADNLW